jgi:CHAT domain-containing protein/tetratricopeptide (TPR) repeat protein
MNVPKASVLTRTPCPTAGSCFRGLAALALLAVVTVPAAATDVPFSPWNGVKLAQAGIELGQRGMDCDQRFEDLAQRIKKLAQDGNWAEALSLNDVLVESTRGNALCEQTFQFVGLMNRASFYEKASELIRKYIAAKDYTEALLLLEPLARSFRVQYGETSRAYSNVTKDLEAVRELHKREFANLYTQTASLMRVGRHADALPLAEQIARVGRAFEKTSPDRYGDALTLLAEALQNLGRYTEAVPPFKRAVELIESAFGPDTSLIANRRERLGRIYDAIGYFNEAEEQYKLAFSIRERVARELQSPAVEEFLAGSLHTLGKFYLGQGRFSEAEPLLKRAVEVARSAVERSDKSFPELDAIVKDLGAVNTIKINLADALNNHGLVLTALRHYEEAEAAYRQAYTIEREVRGENNIELAIILNNLALLYNAQSLYEKADAEIARAAELALKLFGDQHPALAPFLHTRAMFAVRSRDLKAGEAMLRGALILRERSLRPDAAELALSHSSLAWALFDQQNWAEAYQHFDQATAILTQRALREARAPHASAENNTQANIGQAGSAFVGQLAAAYELALQQPERQDELLAAGLRIAQWARNAPAGVAVIRMAARFGLGDPKLTKLVRERQDLVARWRVLDQGVTAASAMPDRAKAADLFADLASVNGSLREIDRQLESGFGKFTMLANPEPVSPEDVRRDLRESEALITFFDLPDLPSIKGGTIVWIITKNERPRWYRVPLATAALAEAVLGLRCGVDATAWRSTRDDPTRPLRCAGQLGSDAAPGWDANGELTKLPRFDVMRAYQLYKALFSPVEALIKDKELLIVPAGPLTALPLQVLITEPPTPGELDYAKQSWLGTRNVTTILPSVMSLHALRESAKPSHATKAFVGFGNPLLTGEDGTDRRAWAIRDCSNTFPDGIRVSEAPSLRTSSGSAGTTTVIDQIRRQSALPETRDELCAAARAANADAEFVNLGERATEARVKELSSDGTLADFRIAHFATHGLVADETQRLNAMSSEPALILTPPDRASELDDGLLTASEIALLRLDAEWVILSACNTAAGDSKGAEALSGLARAFLYAGARTLLVSHWVVNSSATVTLITTAASAARDPSTGKAGALRQAIRQFLQQRSGNAAHPALWGPFVVVGQGWATSN